MENLWFGCAVKEKERGGEFGNVLMKRVGNPFWVDVFKHYKKLNSKCVPSSFEEFASEKLHYNVNICRDNKVIFIKSWIENGILAVGHLLGQYDYLSYNEFKVKYPDVSVNFLLFEGIVQSIKCYQNKLGLVFDVN